MKRSSDDEDKTYVRSERVFFGEGQYYFATREGVDQGPFATRDDAEATLRHYIQTQRVMERVRSRVPGEATFTHDEVATILETSTPTATMRSNLSN